MVWLSTKKTIICSSYGEIRWAVQEELNGCLLRVEHRRVHRALVRNCLIDRKHNVKALVKELDQEGVMLIKRGHLCRRKYSSMDMTSWFSIHWCINGFSRKILGLHDRTSNKDPNVKVSFGQGILIWWSSKLYYHWLLQCAFCVELVYIHLSSLDSTCEKWLFEIVWNDFLDQK